MTAVPAFDEILGQPTAIETLRSALASGRVHHAYRFEGPRGVGKELTALAFAQALLCDHQGCGDCSTCRRVRTLSETPPVVPLHPDVLLVARGLYTGTVISAKETNGIGVEQIRKVVLGRVGYAPHEGRALCVIVRDAEELTVSAANALLKTLEEPHAGVHFVLLTSRPNRLLDTVRSRTLAVRFGPLPDEAVQAILRQRGLDEELSALAQGSAEKALELAEDERRAELDEFGDAIERALRAPSLVEGLALASDLPKDRHALASRLLHYAQRLAVANRDLVRSDPALATARARRYEVVQRTVDALEQNATPQLAMEAMLAEMRSAALG